MNIVNISSAKEKLKRGFPLIFQTDTLPAIGCLPEFSEIIYKVKKRDKNKPLILLGSKKKQLIDYVHESAKEDFENIASKFWPGALTIITPLSEKKKNTTTSKDFTIGLRVPNSNMAIWLLEETGPLLTSSANISGIQTSNTIEGISSDFPNVDILGPLPWGKCSGSASTIISWIGQENWKLIRKGQVSIENLS
tara:strand:+ start:902 stop:1483 length:582 start_codon:yes stop_codon:yes gene_type:complete